MTVVSTEKPLPGRVLARPSRSRLRTNLASAALVGAATVFGAVGTAVLAPPAAAIVAPGRQGRENPAAAAAITALTGERADDASVLPADFPADAGYRPVVREGLLVNPDGGCSSPVALPSSFEIPCQAHDLGYDLLRYAQHHGGTLGPWARRRLDDRLDQRMHAACSDQSASATGCFAAADLAASAVAVNSWRQSYGDPVPEHLSRYAAVGIGAGLLTVISCAQRRRDREAAPAAAALA